MEFNRYADNGRLQIRLFDAEDGMPMYTLTTNIPTAKLKDDEIAVKIWGENEGVIQKLQMLDYFGQPIRWCQGTFICKCLHPEASHLRNRPEKEKRKSRRKGDIVNE